MVMFWFNISNISDFISCNRSGSFIAFLSFFSSTPPGSFSGLPASFSLRTKTDFQLLMTGGTLMLAQTSRIRAAYTK